MTKEERKKSAAERQQARQSLTPRQQLAILDERLGKGVGAAKERARLQALIDKEDSND